MSLRHVPQQRLLGTASLAIVHFLSGFLLYAKLMNTPKTNFFWV
jgi:hypothetical protein